MSSGTYDAPIETAPSPIAPRKIDAPAVAARVARFLRRGRLTAMHQEVRR
jgi:hypothetical protein